MKKFCLFFLLSTVCIVSFSNAEQLSIENPLTLERAKITASKFRNYRDWIMWIGSDFSQDFNPNYLNSNDAKRYELKGLPIAEDGARNGITVYQSLLAGYYYNFVRDYKKALYWAFLSAESGDVDGMSILASAYIKGDGIIQDSYEAAKWFILAAALGKEESKRNLSALQAGCVDFYNEGSRRAHEWMQSHKSLFFSPD